MKIVATLCIMFTLVTSVYSQNKNSFFLSAGRSFNGTGDLKGIAVDVLHEHQLSKPTKQCKRLGQYHTMGHHSGFNSGSGASPREKLLRYTIAGLQLNSQIGFWPKPSDNKINIAAGPCYISIQLYPSMFEYVQDPRFYFEPFNV